MPDIRLDMFVYAVHIALPQTGAILCSRWPWSLTARTFMTNIQFRIISHTVRALWGYHSQNIQ